MALGDPIDNPASFHQEALYQGLCQVTDCEKPGGEWHAHHVLYEQICFKLGLAIHDTRNSLRVCTGGFLMGGCHGAHHNRKRLIRVQELTDGNILFIVEGLGARAADWLGRYYDATVEDPRLVEAMHMREVG